jgi:cell shape-determining protein MreC
LNLETWAFYAALLAIVAVIGLVAAGIYILVNNYNSAANASKKAAEEAATAAEQYEKVKTKYDELKKSLEDYEDARNAIKYLVEGTDEWKQSIAEANDKA